jgi:FKBP-type peptidyl-prolyl cis-trans isomerase FklB
MSLFSRSALALAGTLAAQSAFAATTLKTEQDKISYAIGFQIGSNFKRDGLEVDTNMLLNGMKEALKGEKSPLNEEETRTLMMNLQKNLQSKAEAKQKAEGEKNAAAGKKFLDENAKKSGVKKTASGLQYKVNSEGKGESPKATDTVKVNYKGTLLDGTEFDSSYKRGKPAEFPVNGVIKGWTEALQMMKPGAKYELWIPADLAYGDRGAGDKIGPNSTLHFEVELLEIVKQPPAEAKAGEPAAPAAATPSAAPKK